MAVFVDPEQVVSARSSDVGSLLSNSRYFIPNYQREYAWGGDELQQLWRDITAVAEGLRQQRTMPHFMGPFVVIGAASGAEEVIDGQQRLVTFTCFAAVLLEYADRIPESKRMLFTTTLHSMMVASSGEPRLRLNYGNELFAAFIATPTSRSARDAALSAYGRLNSVDERLRDAVAFFRERVDVSLSGASADEVLTNHGDVLKNLLIGLKIRVSNHEMAYALFETLNNRGVELSQADLLKNELFRASSNDSERNEIFESWTDVMDKLARIEITKPDFLQYQFVSKYSETKREDLFETVRAYLRQAGEIVPSTYARQLSDDAGSLERIVFGIDPWRDAKPYIEDTVRLLGARYSYVPLIAIDRVFPSDPNTCTRAARVVRNFTFRFLKVQRESVERFTRILGEAAREVDSARTIDPMIKRFTDESPDNLFVARLAEYETTKATDAFFAIRCYEVDASAGEGVIIQPQGSRQHLEHILPKRPQQDWPEIDPDGVEFVSSVHRLGNLLVLEARLNQAVKNKGFGTKLSRYAESALKLPRRVDEFAIDGRWTGEAIRKRQAALAEQGPVVWPLS